MLSIFERTFEEVCLLNDVSYLLGMPVGYLLIHLGQSIYQNSEHRFFFSQHVSYISLATFNHVIY